MVSHCKLKISRLVAGSDWQTGSRGGSLAVRLWKKKKSNNNNSSHKRCCITAAARGQRIIPARIQRSTDTSRDGWEISEDRGWGRSQLMKKQEPGCRQSQQVDWVTAAQLQSFSLIEVSADVWGGNCCHTNIVFFPCCCDQQFWTKSLLLSVKQHKLLKLWKFFFLSVLINFFHFCHFLFLIFFPAYSCFQLCA